MTSSSTMAGRDLVADGDVLRGDEDGDLASAWIIVVGFAAEAG